VLQVHAHSSGSAALWYLADRGFRILVALHEIQAEAPVVVGRVVWPAAHGAHVLEEMALTSIENLPAAQLEHFFVVPSL
jgi:hypothetical protein